MTSRTVSSVGSMSVSDVRERIACSIVEQPPQRVRVRGGETAGALRARAVAHPAATGRDIQMVSGSPPDPGSRSTSTKPLRA